MDRIIIDEETIGMRIDQFMANTLPEYSRGVIQGWIDEGKIKVNNTDVKRNYRLKASDVVEYKITITDVSVSPISMNLDIVYEDDDIIIINKPKGLIVHPSETTLNQPTLVHGLLAHTRNLSGLNGSLRPGIVHRIDKDTSGLLVIAKNDEVHQTLVDAIKERQIKREYIALVHHAFSHQSAVVDAPIGRDPKNRQRMCVTDKGSKHALTRLFLLERFKEYSVLRCELDTGRTHQIRVHCQYIKHPIVGDRTYSYKNTPDTSGQCLHAYKLTLTHPRTHQELTFTTDIPSEMEQVIAEIRRVE